MHTSMSRAEAKIREKITLLTFRCQGPGRVLLSSWPIACLHHAYQLFCLALPTRRG